MTKTVSIKDVANQLGVSVASVSLALNGKSKKGRVSDALTEKIRITAKAMNYKPNSFAKGLRSGRSETIGLILADISNPFFAHLAFHVQENAEKCGYSVIITNTNFDIDKMRRMISVLKSHQVDGFIIVPTEHSEKLVEQLVMEKYPVVLLDRYFMDIDVSYVCVNNYHASMEATNLLLNMNCQRIAQVIIKDTSHHMQERKKGYIDAMTHRGLYDPKLIKEVNFTTLVNDVQKVIVDLVSSKEKVDGIFFTNNTTCVIALKTLIKLQLKIPKDIKVVCFDKSDFFDLSNISIPYIEQPISEMGRRAVELLIRKINKEDEHNVFEELQTTLMW